MSHTNKESVKATEVFTVTAVAGHEPAALDDFVGATTLTVRGAHGEHQLIGAGARDGEAIQFRERQLASAADDMPVWEIVASGDALSARPSSRDWTTDR